MAFTNDGGNKTPYQLNQNSGGGLNYGQKVVSQYGTSVSGGSTVSASSYQAPPGSPGSLVYLGANNSRTAAPKGPYAPGYKPMGTPYTGSDNTKYENAIMQPLDWSDKQLKSFVNKGILYKLPGFGADMGMPEIMSAWDDLVKTSQGFSRPGQEWTPFDVMETYNQKPGSFGTVKSSDGDWLLDARTGEKIKYIGPRSKTTTEKRVDLSSPEDVRALSTQMLTELLGRAPTSEELAKYRTSISGLEKANPTIARTTTTINDQGEATDSSTTTSGGVSDAARQGLIGDAAKEGPEYGKFQSATTYFNAMMQMMGG